MPIWHRCIANQLPQCFRAVSRSRWNSTTTVHSPLTVLKKTSDFLPKVLPKSTDCSRPEESLEFWDRTLSAAYDRLVPGTEQPIRVVVAGNESSSIQNLVSALLEAPLAPDGTANLAIQKRWEGREEEKLVIQHADIPSQVPGVVSSTSSFLRQWKVPIHLFETAPSRVNPEVYDADVAIVIFDPLLRPSSEIFGNSLLNISHQAIVILTAIPSPESTNWLSTLSSSGSFRPQVVFVDPSRAVSALRTIQANPSSVSSVQRYQDEWLSSGMPNLIKALRSLLPSSSRPSLPVYTRSGIDRIRASLEACKMSLQAAERQVNTIQALVRQTESQISDFRARIHIEVLGSEDNDAKVVNTALNDATANLHSMFQRLTWWRAIWQVDELDFIISGAVDRLWCNDLEKWLIFKAGRLSALQTELKDSALALVDRSKNLNIQTALLQNAISQTSSFPGYLLESHSLTSALRARRNQINQYPSTRLHIACQHIVVGVTGTCLAGGSVAGTATLGWLTQFGIDTPTGLGLGLFIAVAGLRWAVSKWEKAKKKWWMDVHRVGDGLKRDLQENLREVVENQILSVPSQAIVGLSQILSRRKEEVDELKDELVELKQLTELLPRQEEIN